MELVCVCTLKFVTKTQDYQQYGAPIPDEMINQDIKDSKAYKTDLDFATRKATPKKARKFKKDASPSRKLSPVLEEEPVVKPKRAKRPVKMSTTVPTAGVVIRDTPSESVLNKKTPAKVDRGKGMDLLSDVALLEAARLKKTLKKSKLETHKLHASGSDDGVGSQPKVPDEQEDKTTGTDEGTGTKLRFLMYPNIYLRVKINLEEIVVMMIAIMMTVTKDDDDDDDDGDSDVDGDNEASNSEKIDSDEDENPNLNQNDDEEEEYEEAYVCTPDSFEFIDDDEEYDELYKDVNVRLQATEHEKEGKEDEEMTDAGHDDGTQQTTYEQVKHDEHVILTTVHDTQKTEVPLQSSSVSSDFANQFLNMKKLSNLERDVIYDLNVALRMFTRHVVILKQVEDLQLGFETKPETFRSDITNMTPYIAYNNPQEIIYLDKFKRSRLMRSDELYKFCDGTLKSVRRVLYDIASILRMDYLPKRRWSKLDKRRSRIMIKAIDQQLFERRLMRNLEKFVGGRDYGNDLRLLERTI
ncbi:hypothetical protein Tco_0259926 [Tanacetum coccineum]